MLGKKLKLREVTRTCGQCLLESFIPELPEAKTKLHQDLRLAMKSLPPGHQNQIKSMKQATRPILHFSKSHNFQIMHAFYIGFVS